MRKAALVVLGVWALLIAWLAVVWIVEADRGEELFAGVLVAMAAILTAYTQFRIVKPGNLARLKDQVLIAQLRSESAALDRDPTASAVPRSALHDVMASGVRLSVAAGVAGNAALISLAFFVMSERRHLSEEDLLVILVSASVALAAYAALWLTNEVTRAARLRREAGLRATLRGMETYTGDVPVVVRPPPLPRNASAGAQESGAAPAGTEAAAAESRAGQDAAPTPLKLGTVWIVVFAVVVVAAKAGRLKGAISFGWGMGLALAGAAVSLPFGALLLLVARKWWKVRMSFGEAYTVYFAGVVAAMLPLHAVDAFTAASLFYPTQYGAAAIASNIIVPPLVWAACRLADGPRIGIKRAMGAMLVLAPIGFGFGLLWTRLFAA